MDRRNLLAYLDPPIYPHQTLNNQSSLAISTNKTIMHIRAFKNNKNKRKKTIKTKNDGVCSRKSNKKLNGKIPSRCSFSQGDGTMGRRKINEAKPEKK